ncbi:unnamed protein product [Trifolium pratense]|uniref:Uncharacterized protein n=1 Tax=Trifolium pratense TaxID=57577 RepID=A0ACB0LSG9_TRIPR|nr:unnamed protein product [Trifolium pratense]
MASSSNDCHNFSVKFEGRQEHFKLPISKLSSLAGLKNKIEEMFLLKNNEHIQIQHMAYLNSCTDITSDSIEATTTKYWYKLKGDLEVQLMFSFVENENEPHRLYATLKKSG